MALRSHPTRRPFKAGAAVAAGVAALTALAACGSSSGSSSTSATGSASGGTTSNSAVTYAKAQIAKYEAGIPPTGVTPIANMPNLKGKTVWYVPIGDSVPVLAAFGAGVKQALSHVGASTHVCDGNFLPTAIANCLQQATTQGAAAVITSFIDYSLIPTAINNVVAHHIPVLIGAEPPTDGKTSSSALTFYDTSDGTKLLGQVDADAAIADSGGKANILYVNLTDSSSTEEATQGAKAEVAAHCPGCTFQTVDMQTAKVSDLPSAISAKLVSDPSINYVLNSDDTFVTQIVSGIRSAGAGTRVKVLSAAGDLAGLQRISANQMETDDVGTNTQIVGWYFADSLLRQMAGVPIPPSTDAGFKLFDSSNVKGLSLTPAAYSDGSWFGSNSWQQTFLKAWGVN